MTQARCKSTATELNKKKYPNAHFTPILSVEKEQKHEGKKKSVYFGQINSFFWRIHVVVMQAMMK